MQYEELKLLIWGPIDDTTYGAKALLSDGESFEIGGDDILALCYIQENSISKTEKGYVIFLMNEPSYVIFILDTVGTNLEVPITATAPDGTEYSITVYITNE